MKVISGDLFVDIFTCHPLPSAGGLLSTIGFFVAI